MQTHRGFFLALLSFTLTTANAASAYPEYRVTVVGPANSTATDINGAGVVVGTYFFRPTVTHGFLNRGKGLVDLGALGGSASSAAAINGKGMVLGNWTTNGGQQRGFIHYQGRQRGIGALPGRVSTHTDINNAGFITAIGASPDPADGVRSFLREPGGRLRDIGNLPSEQAPLSYALALNNRNEIAGTAGERTIPDELLRAFIWRHGAMRDLGDFGSGPNGAAAINDRGQVTGHMALLNGYRSRVAFLYSNGRLINIDGRPDNGEERSSSGAGINNHGHVVGSSDHLSGFIYRGRRMQSLNTLIDRRLGWDIVAPQAINDAGQIAATAYRKGVAYAVRLDLIRPHALAAPVLEEEEGASTAPGGLPAETATEGEAQAREMVQAVEQ